MESQGSAATPRILAFTERDYASLDIFIPLEEIDDVFVAWNRLVETVRDFRSDSVNPQPLLSPSEMNSFDLIVEWLWTYRSVQSGTDDQVRRWG